MESYMQYLVGYFHEPYQQGDDISKNNLLYLSIFFCFANKDQFDFVKTNEENFTMRITGKELERIAADLIPHTGDLSPYHTTMEDFSDFYSAETDTYVVSYAKGDWNADLYSLGTDENGKVKKPQISETDTELIVVAETCYTPDFGVCENVRKMEYRFEKVIDGGFLFYRLSGIRELS